MWYTDQKLLESRGTFVIIESLTKCYRSAFIEWSKVLARTLNNLFGCSKHINDNLSNKKKLYIKNRAFIKFYGLSN